MITIKTEGKKKKCPACHGSITNYRTKTNDFRCRECSCVWEDSPETETLPANILDAIKEPGKEEKIMGTKIRDRLGGK